MIEKNNDKKVNELLEELTKENELKNKRLMQAMYTLLIVSLIFYLGIVFITIETLKEGLVSGIIICLSTILFLIAAFISLKFEVDAGYYECGKCHNRFVPLYRSVLMAIHMGTTRYLKCPKCNKRSWSKKVMSKNK